eukprot:Awhi_evm1s10795
MVGGIAGLVGAILVGHRNGFIEPHTGLPQVIPGHSLALSTTGTLLLWFGWFPFNAGGQNVSQGGIFTISLILTNTLISASAAGIEAWPVNAEDLSFFFYNVAFACTAVTIVSGCVVERTKTLAYLHFTFWFSIIVYPICAHWAWTKNGFLNNIVDGVDFLDFAGSGV